MPFNPVKRTFKNASGRAVTRWPHRVDPPVSPATEAPGPILTLYDTPKTADDRYCAALAGGPSGRVRLEISIAGGAWTTLTAAGVAHGGVIGTQHEVRFRAVHLDASAINSEVASFVAFIRSPGGEASFLGEP